MTLLVECCVVETHYEASHGEPLRKFTSFVSDAEDVAVQSLLV